MTNKEAIEILKRLQDPEPWEPKINKVGLEALDMAIAALEKQEGEGGLTMAKYIEREAALSAVDCGNLHKGIVDALQENIKDIPAADVVDGDAYREILKAARKMHCWIFLNTADELDAYDECGLTDEMNALLGYGGQFTANMDGGVNDDKSD